MSKDFMEAEHRFELYLVTNQIPYMKGLKYIQAVRQQELLQRNDLAPKQNSRPESMNKQPNPSNTYKNIFQSPHALYPKDKDDTTTTNQLQPETNDCFEFKKPYPVYCMHSNDDTVEECVQLIEDSLLSSET